MRLGSVHGEVSVVNDRFRRCAVIRDQRSTDGGSDRVRMFADLDLALEAPDKAQSNRVSGVSVDIVAKYSELIPAEPSEEIAGTSDCPKAPRNRLQDPIPERVTVKIIDPLEVIEVYQKECMLAAVGRRRSGSHRQRFKQCTTVCQIRQ